MRRNTISGRREMGREMSSRCIHTDTHQTLHSRHQSQPRGTPSENLNHNHCQIILIIFIRSHCISGSPQHGIFLVRRAHTMSPSDWWGEVHNLVV